METPPTPPLVREAQEKTEPITSGPRPSLADTQVVTPPDLGPAKQGAELVDRRSATSKTFATERPGEFVTELSSTPVHYKADGTWKQIDPTLALGKDGRLHNKGAPFDVSLAAEANDASVARLSLDADHSVGFALEGAARVKGTASKDVSTYAGVRRDTALRLTSRPNGLKEELVLASPAAPDRFVFPLQLKGLTASIVAGGDVVYRDKAGVERARTPHGYMYDSKVDPRSDEAPTSLGVTFSLVPHGKGGTALVVTLDRAWLDDPAREYPVTVDPEFVANTEYDDTYVMKNFTRNNSADPELKVGTYDGGTHIGRSYLHFSTAPLAGKVVHWGRLEITESHSWNCAAAAPTPYRVVQGWWGETMTGWPGAAYDIPAGGVLTPSSGTCPNRRFWADMNGASANWASGAWNNLGIVLLAPNEGDNNLYKKFKSFETGDPPVLRVGWTDPAPPPATVPSAPQNVVATARNLSASVSWAPPANNGGAAVDHYVVYAYSYPSGAYANAYAFPPCPTCTSATVPGLANGQQYYFTVYAHNAVGWGPPGISNVIVPAPQPPGAPGNPAATARNQSAIVSWTAPADNGGAAIQYYGVFAYSYPSYTYLSYTQGCATCTSVSVPNLTNGQQYAFGIYAYNGVNWGAGVGTNAVTPAVTTPNAPATVIASPGDASATVAWSAPTDNGGAAITSAWIMAYTTSPSLAYANRYLEVCATCTSGTVTGLTNGVSYKFIAFASNSVGNGAYTWSNAVVPGSAPDLLAPTSVMASRGDRQVTLTWTRPGLRLEGLTSYVVKVFAEGDPTTVLASTTVTDPTATAVVPGLTNGMRYVATVTASTALIINVTSSASAPFVPAGPPSASATVAAMAGNGRAFVAWDAADGNGATVTSYTIKASPGNITARVEGNPAPVHGTVPGLTNGTSYTFTVVANNGVANGAESAASEPVTPMAPFTTSAKSTPLAAGGQHSLVVHTDGTVFAYGMNTYGQLGLGSTQNNGAGAEIPGLANVVSVTAGDRHSLALKSDGTVWAWGDNAQGQLGVDPAGTAISTRPTRVPGLTGITAISAGLGHSLALRTDGKVFAWGSNSLGQLASSPEITEPHVVEGVPSINAVAAGFEFSMALAADGSVWAWGDNRSGQTRSGSSSSATPNRIVGLTGIRSISAGRAHALAVTAGGAITAWGDNSSGQLGVGDNQPRSGLVQVQGLQGVAGIGAGERHSTALMDDGAAWAWGANDNSQLGAGPPSIPFLPYPIQVLRQGGGNFAGGRLIAAGANQSLLVDASGVVWEYGAHYALGDPRCEVATRKTTIPKAAVAAAAVVAGVAIVQATQRFVADTTIFADRERPLCRAAIDAIVFNLPITLLVPEAVDRELTPTPTALFRRAGLLGIATVVDILDGVVTPADRALLSQDPINGPFNENDAAILNAAEREGVPVITSNNALTRQISSDNPPGRKARWGAIPIIQVC